MLTKIKKMNWITHRLLALSLFFFSVSSMAETRLPKNLVAGWDNISQKTIKQDVSILTADHMQGRLALLKGDALAVEWIKNQFKQIGLKPAAQNSYLQPVKLIAFMPDKEHSYISLDASGKTIRWKKPDVTTDYRDNIHLQSVVYFAGYGITAPDLNYDDYKGIDVKGKIVLIFEHEPQERNPASIFNGTGNTIYATNRIKALNAQKHGAIAVLIAPEPNRKHLSNLERYNRIGGSVSRKKPIPSMALLQDELHIPVAVLSDKVANQIAGKSISLASLQATIDSSVASQSTAIPNVTVTIHDQIKFKKAGISYNVVGLLEGSDAALKKETIIVSAHHDHDGISGKQIWHGADDNASGTVGVITLARAIKTNMDTKQGRKLKRSILFVVFAAEERGLLGSYEMAEHPLRPLKSTRAMLNFDMIGRNEAPTPQTNGMIDIPIETNNRLNLIGAHYSPDYKNTVAQQNEYVGLTLDDRFDNETALNVFFRSDQFPFVLRQIPALWWFTGFHPDYHHISDTANKINYAKMQKILRLAYLSTYAFANDVTNPAFIKNPGGN